MLKTIFIFSLCLFSISSQAKVDRPPQYVVLAFDGSKNIDFWQKSRAFAAANKVRYTYFVSGVYFITDANRKNYVEPHYGAGKSNIGFGGTTAKIQQRLEQVVLASDEGHEMASHANAHFDGSKYSESQWNKENDQFTKLLMNSWKDNGVASKEPSWWKNYFLQKLTDDPGMVGFRAPLLGVGPGLWPSLASHGILYDTSRVDKMAYWPKEINGIWNFPLAGLTITGSGKKTLSMDYNFYFADSKGVAGPASQYAKYEEQMYKTYMGYFENNYYGNRAPLHIGHHFSQWNGGAYWKAMQRFAKSVCTKPEVVCANYKELLAFISQNENQIAAYQIADFDKLKPALKPAAKKLPPVRELTDAEMIELRKNLPNHFNAHDE